MHIQCLGICVRDTVFKATFNNILVLSRRSALLVEEIGGPRKNHWPAGNYWQTLSHNVVSSIPRLNGNWTHTMLVVIGIDCIGSCKSNYHTITTMTAPYMLGTQAILNIYCIPSLYRFSFIPDGPNIYSIFKYMYIYIKHKISLVLLILCICSKYFETLITRIRKYKQEARMSLYCSLREEDLLHHCLSQNIRDWN